MPDPQRPPDLVRELVELRRRVETLERAARMPSASIGSGGLRVLDGGKITIVAGTDSDAEVQLSSGAIQMYDPSSNSIFYVGELFVGGVSVGYGMLIREPDGTIKLETYAGNFRVRYDDGTGALSVLDSEVRLAFPSGTRAATVDANGVRINRPDGTTVIDVTADGIGTPVEHFGMSVPGVTTKSTTSSSYEDLAEAYFHSLYPYVVVDVAYTTTSSIGFDVQLYDAQRSTEIDVTSLVGGGGTLRLGGAISGPFQDLQWIKIRGRVTSGSGTLSVRPINAFCGVDPGT